MCSLGPHQVLGIFLRQEFAEARPLALPDNQNCLRALKPMALSRISEIKSKVGQGVKLSGSIRIARAELN